MSLIACQKSAKFGVKGNKTLIDSYRYKTKARLEKIAIKLKLFLL